MREPTARELIDGHKYAACACDGWEGVIKCLLASRVEKVLAYCDEERGHIERRSLAREIIRMLDGEQL